MRVTKSRLVVVLNLIGREDVAIFLHQSPHEVKQNQNNFYNFRHSIENCFINSQVDTSEFCLQKPVTYSLSFCLFVYLFVCLSICLSFCLSVCLSVCPPVCLSVCLFVCRSVCLSVCLLVCLSVSLSNRLHVCFCPSNFCQYIYISVHVFLFSLCLSVCRSSLSKRVFVLNMIASP